MIRTPSFRRLSRAAVLSLLAIAMIAASSLIVPEARTQAPAAAATSNAQLTVLLAKLKTQQDQLADNQTKIEAQTAQLKEELRQARIYSGRGGSRR